MRRVVVLAFVLAAGCGTTVPMGGAAGPTARQSADASLGGAQPLPQGSAGAVGPGGGGSSRPGSGTIGGTATDGSASGAQAPGSAPTSPGHRQVGVTATTITVGLSTATSAGSTGADIGSSFGISGFSSGPDKPLQLALIDHYNRLGGLGGRKIVPVFHAYSGTDARPYAVQDQEACTYFTQDHKVFAHLADVVSRTFYSCMESAGTVGVERYELGSQQLGTHYPGIFSVSDLDYTTAGRVLVEDLVRRSFLTRASRIGLVQTDTPDMDSARAAGIDVALRRAGLKLTDIARVSAVNQASDAGQAIQGVSGAVLKFSTDRVDRVLFLSPNGALLDAIFMKQAEQQGYRPKYGLASHDAPVALGGGNAPDAQLQGAGAIGWSPLEDLATVPKSQQPASVRTCLAILREDHLSAPSDRGQLNQYLGYCGAFMLFAQIVDRAGRDLTRDSFIRAGNALGTSYDDPFSITGYSRITSGPHQAVGEYQPIAYASSCQCFQPVGSVVRFR